MNPHNIPPLPSLDQLPAPGITSTNPGLVNPADQSYPAVKNDADQTRIAGTHASASMNNSNGEQQRVHDRAMANSGVSVSAASVPLTDFSGDSGHHLDMRSPEEAQSTGTGLPAEVFPGAVNHARMMPPVIAVPLPPSVNVPADTRISGGLPINVHIR
jgi:hypothetical protein